MDCRIHRALPPGTMRWIPEFTPDLPDGSPNPSQGLAWQARWIPESIAGSGPAGAIDPRIHRGVWPGSAIDPRIHRGVWRADCVLAVGHEVRVEPGHCLGDRQREALRGQPGVGEYLRPVGVRDE